jgi:predicted ferric reductase
MIMVLIVYLLLPAVQVLFYLQNQLELFLPEVLNFVCSIASLHWILANIVLASKLPGLDRYIAYDKRIRIHVLSSIGIALGVAYHGGYKIVMQYRLDLFAILLMVGFSFFFLSAVLWIPLPGFRAFRNWFINKIHRKVESDYDKSKTLHSYTVLVLSGLILFHIASAGIFTETQPVSASLYLLFYLFSMGTFLYSRYIKRPIKSTVLSVEQQEDIIILQLQPEKHLLYNNGQFAFIGHKGDRGGWREHPFSFLSAPDAGTGSEPESVSFAIKRVGDFTRTLASLQPGEEVRIRGPFGNFHPEKGKKACLIGSGIGIVPLISVVKGLSKESDIQEIRMFFAVNKKDEIPEREAILKIADEVPGLKIHMLVYSEDGILFSEEYLKSAIPEPQEYSYYICSSPNVRRILLNILKTFGIQKAAIHFEAFSFG